MTFRRGAAGVIARVLALALVVTGCGVTAEAGGSPTTTAAGGSSASTSEPETGATTTTEGVPKRTTLPGELAVPTLDWRSCDGGFECTSMQVPLDYSDPSGPTIEVAMTRRPASDAGRRVGALFVNPGGPGASAIDYAEGFAGNLPDEVTDRFDIVGIDPRGVGRSTPMNCDGRVAAMYSVDPTIEDATDRRNLLAASQRFVDDCKRSEADLLPHLSTRDVARDMDLARAAMGDAQLTYFGYSYGTALGQVYAELFPKHVRAMVLDGITDISRSGVDGALLQAEGFEQALRAFANDCARDDRCPLGSDPLAVVDRVTARAERTPIPADGADRPAGPAEVDLGLMYALYHERNWPDLAAAFTAADGSDPDATQLVDLADAYVDLAEFGPFFATSCLDASWPKVDPLLAAAKAAARAAPHFGESITTDYVRCSLWPVEPRPLAPVTHANVRGLAPVVLVSTTGDPATPYESGVDLAGVLPGSVLITVEGADHTGALHGNSCVDEPVIDYLVTLALPPAGLRCD